MKRVLITGGSGFIGSNLIEHLLNNSLYNILNLDIESPRVNSQVNLWQKIDICDKKQLSKVITRFNPNIIIHLAARTDLNGKNIEYYKANTIGVSNLIEASKCLADLERVIFTSSMYVCQPGYSPKNSEDYHPHTIYGESKVITEKIIKSAEHQYIWTIIRPTSIWGPWFKEPYADFFNIVLKRRFFHMGSKACRKTYGYIENTTYQIECLLNVPKDIIHKKVFYLGDWPEYNISEWANEIAQYSHIVIPSIPFALFRILGWGGDLLKVFGIKFPMTSFRLKNMTTDNIQDLSMIKRIVPNLPVTRQNGVRKTIDWINNKDV